MVSRIMLVLLLSENCNQKYNFVSNRKVLEGCCLFPDIIKFSCWYMCVYLTVNFVNCKTVLARFLGQKIKNLRLLFIYQFLCQGKNNSKKQTCNKNRVNSIFLINMVNYPNP